MYWPTADDYCEALQDPKFCFALPELQSAEVAETPHGLPKVISGRLASVYKLTAGGEQIALRCFLVPVPDQSRRYAVIGRHLRSTKLPYLADFEYLRQGIKINGAWYPVLKMQWVKGEPLMRYVERHLQEPGKLRSLAKAWLRMLSDLRRNRIAHGDLHHENILVQDGRLKLIDYDGMFVPGLEELASQELGHRHYQHPKRSKQHFGPYLDNFAGWVVYLSLLALSHKPELWELADEEHLLFRQEDFLHPCRTRIWQELAQLPQMAALATEFRSMLQLLPERVTQPHALGLLGSLCRTAPERKRQPAKPAVEFKGPDWVLDYLPEGPDEDEEECEAIAVTQPITVASDLTTALAVWLVICSFLGLATWAELMKPLTAVITTVLFGVIQLLGVWFRRRYCSVGSSHNDMRSETEDNAPGI